MAESSGEDTGVSAVPVAETAETEQPLNRRFMTFIETRVGVSLSKDLGAWREATYTMDIAGQLMAVDEVVCEVNYNTDMQDFDGDDEMLAHELRLRYNDSTMADIVYLAEADRFVVTIGSEEHNGNDPVVAGYIENTLDSLTVAERDGRLQHAQLPPPVKVGDWS